MNAIGTLHTNLVFKRRTRVLAEALARAIPPTPGRCWMSAAGTEPLPA